MATKTVLDHYGVKPVSYYSLPNEYYSHMTFQKYFPNPSLLVGVELEMEGYHDGLETVPMYCTAEADGSLRDGGVELITKPTQLGYLQEVLTVIFNEVKAAKYARYSERCSTHFHVNVQDYTLDQLKTLCLVYATVERVLFDFVGKDRKSNIFCVPWEQSGVATRFISDLDSGKLPLRHWQKYTALNLQPVASQGTVEFRHMYGTCDVAALMEWASILSDLMFYAASTPFDKAADAIINLNTVSNYDQYLRDVFPSTYRELMQSQDCRSNLTEGVIESKLMLLPGEKLTKGEETVLRTVDEHQQRFEQLIAAQRAGLERAQTARNLHIADVPPILRGTAARIVQEAQQRVTTNAVIQQDQFGNMWMNDAAIPVGAAPFPVAWDTVVTNDTN